MKVAAYQAPLLPGGSMAAVELIRQKVAGCKSEGVEILCCPEAVLGGLADAAAQPTEFALDVDSGQLGAALAPLASDRVTTILGFTEISAGDLYNSAVVFHRGAVAGLYRKIHPAIRKSIYRPGDRLPVFTINGLTFGILLCYDANFPELAKGLAAQGATAIFIPTHNALPPAKADVVRYAREADIARARENRMGVVRADVAGRTADLVSFGSSGIVDRDGTVVRTARCLTEDLLIADLGI